MRVRAITVLAVIAMSMAGACNEDEALETCADCPIPELTNACIEAADQCQGIEGMDGRQMCLDEARELCEREPSS